MAQILLSSSCQLKLLNVLHLCFTTYIFVTIIVLFSVVNLFCTHNIYCSLSWKRDPSSVAPLEVFLSQIEDPRTEGVVCCAKPLRQIVICDIMLRRILRDTTQRQFTVCSLTH